MLRRIKWFPISAIITAGGSFLITLLGVVDPEVGIVGALGGVTLAVLSRDS